MDRRQFGKLTALAGAALFIPPYIAESTPTPSYYISRDWLFGLNKKIIRWWPQSGGRHTVYSVQELHTRMKAVFGGYCDGVWPNLPMTPTCPTVYYMNNGWSFYSDEEFKHLRGAAIIDPVKGESWCNVVTIGSIHEGTQIVLHREMTEYIDPWWPPGHVDVLIKDTGVPLSAYGQGTIPGLVMASTQHTRELERGRVMYPVTTCDRTGIWPQRKYANMSWWTGEELA